MYKLFCLNKRIFIQILRVGIIRRKGSGARRRGKEKERQKRIRFIVSFRRNKQEELGGKECLISTPEVFLRQLSDEDEQEIVIEFICCEVPGGCNQVGCGDQVQSQETKLVLGDKQGMWLTHSAKVQC